MILRRATCKDLLEMKELSIQCLAVNYHYEFYTHCLLAWPELSYVAEDLKGKMVGYVLGRTVEDGNIENPDHGHIIELAVKRTYRRLGLAHKLVEQSALSMVEVYSCPYVSLHVQSSNRPAVNLYRKSLNFEISQLKQGYYGPGQDGFLMKRTLQEFAIQNNVQPLVRESFFGAPDVSDESEQIKADDEESGNYQVNCRKFA